MNEVKAKEITEITWFKRLSIIGIIIFSIGSPAYPALYLVFDAGDDWTGGFLMIVLFIPSVILSLILFFIILFIFYRLSPMGKKLHFP